MSYRTFKHLLGETSLERKCRFIFTGGILVLVTFSFWWYGQKTESLVIGQTTYQAARRLVPSIVMDIHAKHATVVNKDSAKLLDDVAQALKSQDDLPQFESKILDPLAAQKKNKKNAPADSFEAAALERFMKATAAGGGVPGSKSGAARKPYTFSDGSPMEVFQTVNKQYEYVQAILFKPDCLASCHQLREDAGGRFVEVKPYDLACAAVVHLSMAQTNSDIHKNRAILISAALVTAILAMIAAYVIVRYVVVKPVKHLRDVSDAIAAGKLTIRSQIQTGDEFEDLSHAFNRMLHNLVSMQQALRDVNKDLDKKVDELAQANMALFEMNRLKSDFLATMSHELRTPLNSIIGFSEVLSTSENLNDRQRRYASNIQSSGKMLLSMINDILDLAKIESGKMEVRPEDFSVRDICESLVSLARPIADRKSITLECKIAEAIPLLRQDPGKLRQILYNLISNAIKFTPDGGRVTLTSRAEGRNVILSVIDNGIGIAEEDREKVFEKFRQAGQPKQSEGVLTREHQGTGLGLSIVRELTKLLGGEIELESTLGQGSTFTIRLPVQLPGNRKFEVSLLDEKIDLSKARRVETRAAMNHLGLVPGDFATAKKPNGEVGQRRDG